jgi:prephenate dehydrogenase
MRQKQKIAIIGVGLLGGSLAKALKGRKGILLSGWNHRLSSRRKAARILSVASSFEEAVRNADIVLLCSHSGSIAQSLIQMKPLINDCALVMDVSSVKSEVMKQASRIPGMQRHFVPCHPMAGREKSGALFADAGLYRDKIVFMTPLSGTPAKLLSRARNFWKSIGAKPVVLDAKKHDSHVALTSHLPHLLASCLTEIYGDEQRREPSLRLAVGNGFKDVTRIAAGHPGMWSDIACMNASAIRRFLTRYRLKLAALEKDLGRKNKRRWLAYFGRVRSIREGLDLK